MTKTQIWLASFLALFLILLVVMKVTRKDETENKMQGTTNMQNQSNQNQTTGSTASAVDLFSRNGCTGCHGSDLAGTQMAPPLKGINANWNRDELINYLRNPVSYMDKGRFKVLREKYPNAMMPSYNNIDVKDLGRMADYLLSK